MTGRLGDHRRGKFGFGIPTDDEQGEDAQGIARYREYAKRHVDARLEHLGDDLISHYIQRLREVEDGRLLFDVHDCYTVMLQLLFAGHETTTNSAGNAFAAGEPRPVGRDLRGPGAHPRRRDRDDRAGVGWSCGSSWRNWSGGCRTSGRCPTRCGSTRRTSPTGASSTCW